MLKCFYLSRCNKYMPFCKKSRNIFEFLLCKNIVLLRTCAFSSVILCERVDNITKLNESNLRTFYISALS
jgi:hypothetical protein